MRQWRFLRFGLVGGGGFVVDTAVLYLAAGLGTGWYVGRLFSYLAAATFTWACNRRFTFEVTKAPSLGEWAAFLLANAVGGLLNYATYAVLMVLSRQVVAHPVLGVAAGAGAGMIVNFFLSARVFAASRQHG